ncbi:MAG: hypothetical protein AAGF11_11235 [Myxococcota bacterium]
MAWTLVSAPAEPERLPPSASTPPATAAEDDEVPVDNPAWLTVTEPSAERRPPPPPPPEPLLPREGVAPLEHVVPAPAQPATPYVPPAGVKPLGPGPSASAVPSTAVPDEAVRPFGVGPPSDEPEPLGPRHQRIVRFDSLIGPTWRIRQMDLMTSLSVEVGPEEGFSATFHTAFIVAPERQLVRALDVPIGFGAVARGQLGDKPVYVSVGLSGGIMVHRAASDGLGVAHRVDPDVRLPLRGAWTIAGVGVSVAVVPGYSVRSRSYERRGVEVWKRHSVRIGLVFGLHWDIKAGRARAARVGRRREKT